MAFAFICDVSCVLLTVLLFRLLQKPQNNDHYYPIDEDYVSALFSDEKVIMAWDDHDIKYKEMKEVSSCMTRTFQGAYEANRMNVNYNTEYPVIDGDARYLLVIQSRHVTNINTKPTEENSVKEITINKIRQSSQKAGRLALVNGCRSLGQSSSVVQWILMRGSDHRGEQRLSAVGMGFTRRGCRISMCTKDEIRENDTTASCVVRMSKKNGIGKEVRPFLCLDVESAYKLPLFTNQIGRG